MLNLYHHLGYNYGPYKPKHPSLWLEGGNFYNNVSCYDLLYANM